jgi:hypothetical protein
MKNKNHSNMLKCLENIGAFLLVPALLLTFLSRTDKLYSQEVANEIIPHAHSHNDYLKAKPLWVALKYGCASIEIDVFAHEGELKVAHVGVGLNKKKTINELYLNPLFAYLEDEEWIYTDQPLVLMIDFKNDSKLCLPLLMEAIKTNKQYFTYNYQGQVKEAPLQLVISGKRFTYSAISHLDSVFVFLDGGIHECNKDFPPDLVARGSSSYGSVFSWRGKGEMSVKEEQLLKDLVKLSIECQTPLRFYAMPAKSKIWEKFLDAGVYWINIDNAKKFANFYEDYLNKKGPPIAQKTF